MFHSLKFKLTLVFGGLMVLLFALLGAFLVDAKSRELTRDLNDSVERFARFTAEEFVDLSQEYLETGSFVIFNRELQSLLRNNTAVNDVSLVDYNGLVRYRLSDEMQSQYLGSPRIVDGQMDLNRVQSQNLSVMLTSGEVVFLKQDENGVVTTVDFNENSLDLLGERSRYENVIFPVMGEMAVEYSVDYSQVDERLMTAKMQILFFALIGLALTLVISYLISVGITRPLNELKKGALKIAKGNFDSRVKVKTKDEVGLLAGTFNKMAKDLKSSTEAMLYQERLKKELELAAKIQAGLLPEEKMEIESLDMAGGLVPASEIGGDAFDYIEMEDGCQLVYLGDVTGHGVPAGIVSSIANAVLFGFKGEKKLMKIVERLNAVLKEKTTANVFMTMALTHWDPKKGVLSYVNAGHPPVFYYSAKKKKVMELKIPGMALAFVDDIVPALELKEFKMDSGDIMVMYSDGVPEATNAKGEQYGIPRARRLIQGACDDLFSSEGIKNALLSDVIDFIGSKERDDDITVVVLKRK